MALLFATYLVVAACSPSGGLGATAASHDIAGTLTIPGADMSMNRRVCTRLETLPGGDVREGDQATLVDEDGTVLGVAELRLLEPTFPAGPEFVCYLNMSFTFTEVPDAKFYQFKIGPHDGPILSRSELQSSGWQFDPLAFDFD